MPTPDFEDWLRRQDIPVEDTTTVEKYLTYLAEELAIHGGSLDVAEAIYPERYDYLPTLDITPVTFARLYEGEPIEMTRYNIAGIPGLWGYEQTMEFAEIIAEEEGYREISEWFREKRRGE